MLQTAPLKHTTVRLRLYRRRSQKPSLILTRSPLAEIYKIRTSHTQRWVCSPQTEQAARRVAAVRRYLRRTRGLRCSLGEPMTSTERKREIQFDPKLQIYFLSSADILLEIREIPTKCSSDSARTTSIFTETFQRSAQIRVVQEEAKHKGPLSPREYFFQRLT